jgi:hypothetical protein
MGLPVERFARAFSVAFASLWFPFCRHHKEHYWRTAQ